MKKYIYRSLIVSIVSIIISTGLWKVGILDSFERLSWDFRVLSLIDKEKTSDDIVLIMIDQDSLDWGENEQGLPWPWPREILTTLVNYATRNGAKSIAFDVLYTEASLYGVDDDSVFGDSIKTSGIFIGASALSADKSNSWLPELPKQDINIEGLDSWLKLKSTKITKYTSLSYPIPEVSNNSVRIANVQNMPDIDGVYRKGALFFIYNDRIIPSLSLASYITGTPWENKISINKKYLTIDDKKIPINNRGDSIINYDVLSENFTTIKAAKIIYEEINYLNDEPTTFDSSIFENSHVIFGHSAAGLMDIRATPLSGYDKGSIIHANMLNNLINNTFIKDQNQLLSVLINFILCFIAGFIFTRFQGAIKGILFYFIFILVPIFITILFYKYHIWFPLIVSALSVLLSLTGAGIVNYTTEGKQKRFIKHAFKQYLSPDFIEHILNDPEKLKLGGEKKEISIFFSDLQGFTTISEGLNPEELTKFINEYLTAMTDIILEEGGTIDKYEGDAIIAFWNAPIDYTDHAVRAVRAALRCQDKLSELRPSFKKSVGHEIYMRIGINTGYAVVGNMGSNTRFDYTMLGDSVNLAARLEGINKQFGSYTMISGKTFNDINGAFPGRELGKVTVVGKKEAITVFEPLTIDTFTVKKGMYETFNKGLTKFYEGNFEECIKILEEIKDLDRISKKYIQKCEDLIKNKSEQWSGIWEMTQK